MPEKHTHTVGQLLSNRGCVRHYSSGNDGFANESYATALAAADEFWDDNLLCKPGDAYSYSTHGYTLAAAALEAAGGDDIKDLLRKRLTTPYGLGTLGAQNFSSSVHRMSIYSTNNAEVATPNNDWKVLGGGIDSSATDLARFGAKLIGGQILNQADRDEMWTAPDALQNYGYGWDLGSEDGTQVVAKGGSWTGNLAYLRLYPEKGISVAVMINSRAGGWSATQLGRDIGSMVLDSVG
jgi:CubicO group peptidase (beta-lactamase class C family)